jgi:hypothetical protein
MTTNQLQPSPLLTGDELSFGLDENNLRLLKASHDSVAQHIAEAISFGQQSPWKIYLGAAYADKGIVLRDFRSAAIKASLDTASDEEALAVVTNLFLNDLRADAFFQDQVGNGMRFVIYARTQAIDSAPGAVEQKSLIRLDICSRQHTISSKHWVTRILNKVSIDLSPFPLAIAGDTTSQDRWHLHIPTDGGAPSFQLQE